MRMIAKELVPFVELAARTGIGAMPGNCIPAAVKYISGCTFTQKNYPYAEEQYAMFLSLRFMRVQCATTDLNLPI